MSVMSYNCRYLPTLASYRTGRTTLIVFEIPVTILNNHLEILRKLRRQSHSLRQSPRQLRLTS